MQRALSRLSNEIFDVLIIGGGATGCFTARDCAMRGLSVALVEAKDFASATSAHNSKLAHGGLRYLRNLEISLVRESLAERRNLMRMAPHMVRPLPFLLPLYIRMGMPAELRDQISDLNTWSVMAVLVGDLIIVAIAAVDSKSAGFTRSTSERPHKTRSAKGSNPISNKKSRSAKSSKASTAVHCRYEGAGCKRTGTQAAMNAHARSCPFKPTISMPKEEKAKAEK